jgi:hypothetical protein
MGVILIRHYYGIQRSTISLHKGQPGRAAATGGSAGAGPQQRRQGHRAWRPAACAAQRHRAARHHRSEQPAPGRLTMPSHQRHGTAAVEGLISLRRNETTRPPHLESGVRGPGSLGLKDLPAIQSVARAPEYGGLADEATVVHGVLPADHDAARCNDRPGEGGVLLLQPDGVGGGRSGEHQHVCPGRVSGC